MRALNLIFSLIGLIVVGILIVIGFFSVLRGCVSSCSAQGVELITVQGLIAECDKCDLDEKVPLGILWVIEKNRRSWNRNHRDKHTFLDQAKLYFSLFDQSASQSYGSRQESIRSGTFSHPTHIDRKHWVRLRRLVHRFLNGEIEDPHPEADHFGGGCDVGRATRNNWKEVARYCKIDLKGRQWCTYFWKVR